MNLLTGLAVGLCIVVVAATALAATALGLLRRDAVKCGVPEVHEGTMNTKER